MSETPADSKDSQVENQEANLEKPGALLKAARERQGLSVDEVAKSLYLTRKKLRDLESDDYDKLQSDVFIKGYLRNYAPLVGLEAEKLVDKFQQINQQSNQHLAAEEDGEEDIPRTLIPKFVVPAGLFGVAAVAAISIFIFIGDKDAGSETVITPASEIDADLAARIATSEVVEEPAGEPNLDRELAAEALELAAREQANQLLAGDSAEPVSGTSTPPATAPGGEPVTPSNTPARLGDNSELRLEFSEDCWVEVRDRIDNLLYYDMAKAGDNIELEGEPPFSMTLGNAQAVTLYLGEELIDTTPRPGNRTAKLVVGEANDE